MKKNCVLYRIWLGLTLGLLLILGYFGINIAHERDNILFIKSYPEVARQGDVVLLRVKCLENFILLEGRFLGRTINFSKSEEKDEYYVLLGIDLTMKSGTYVIDLKCKDKRNRILKTLYKIKVLKNYYKTQELNLPKEMVDLEGEVLQRVREESKRFKKLWEVASGLRYWQGDFILPVRGEVEDNFGWKRIINGKRRNFHSGVDIKADLGDKVVASNDGKIALVGSFYLCGNSVVIDHGQGLYTMYFHLHEVKVRKGDIVRKGEVIGFIGSTGRVTGPHLHWGVRLNKARINPLALIRISSLFLK